MRGTTQDIHVLFNSPVDTTFFLEKDSIGVFTQWLQGDPQRASLLGAQWQVVVFRHHLVQYPDYLKRRRKLTELKITVDESNPHPQDGLFTDEVERTYFSNGGANHRQLAEFYVMVRRAAGNGWVNIISQDRSFERIPMVNTCFVGQAPRTGSQDLPAQFDFFTDMGIHREILQASHNYLAHNDFASGVFESVKNVYVLLQSLGVTSFDGQDLITHCLSQRSWETIPAKQALVGTSPRLVVNQFSDTWEIEEQKGIREIGQGIQRIARNPIAHKPVSDSYIQNRFSNQKEALKFLCLLSYFIERVETPKS